MKDNLFSHPLADEPEDWRYNNIVFGNLTNIISDETKINLVLRESIPWIEDDDSEKVDFVKIKSNVAETYDWDELTMIENYDYITDAPVIWIENNQVYLLINNTILEEIKEQREEIENC